MVVVGAALEEEVVAGLRVRRWSMVHLFCSSVAMRASVG
jgi:hypothetical protein